MKKNILFALLANVVNAGVAWLLLLFLIRFGNNEDIGVYSLAQAIALPIHLFFTLKLRTIQLSDVDGIYKNSDYFNSRVILAVISFFFTIIFSIILYKGEYSNILAISILGLGYSAILIREYFISIYQINERNEYFLYSNIVLGAASFISFIGVYLISSDIIIAIISFSLIRLLSLIVDFIFLKKAFLDNVLLYIKDFNKVRILSVIKVGLPLGITAVIGSLFTSIPRIKLEDVAGLEVLGVFTTLMSLIAFFNLFMSSFSQALIPRLTTIYRDSRRKLVKAVFLWLLILIFGLSVCLVITYYNASLILTLIFSEKYAQYSNEFFIAIVAGCILCVFHYSNMMLNIQRSFKSQVYIYSICVIVCLISSILLIPDMQLKGAIYTSIIGSLVGIVISICVFLINLRKSN